MDDELPGLTYLKMLCEQIPELEVVKAFNSPIIFLSEMPKLDFDLVLMDIEMPEMNGLQIANLLNSKPVIFITAYTEYAVEAFDLEAVDYIRKPVKKERLQQAVLKAVKLLASNNTVKQFIQINTDQGKALIFFDQLCLIQTSESESRDKLAYLVDGTTLKLKNISFDKLQELLPAQDFCRINKKEMIALKAVQVFTYDEITTNIFGNVLKLTLGEGYRNEFLKKVKI